MESETWDPENVNSQLFSDVQGEDAGLPTGCGMEAGASFYLNLRERVIVVDSHVPSTPGEKNRSVSEFENVWNAALEMNETSE